MAGAPYAAPGVDDVAFTQELLAELKQGFCIDSDRVFATGKSNGAGFAALLGCRLPDTFAAVATVAGALYPGTREGCTGRPIPVLAIHGTGDSTIPFDGDADRGLPAIPDFVAGWVAINQCSGKPRTVVIKPDVTTKTWSGCTNGGRVQQVAIKDGGHVWPGAITYSGGGYVSQTLKASNVIWRFFASHELP